MEEDYDIITITETWLKELNNVKNASGNVIYLIYTNALERTASEKAVLRLIPAERSGMQSKSNSLPGKITFKGKLATTDKEKAYLFAEFFGSVFIERPADPELSDFIKERNDEIFFEVCITPEIVEKTFEI